MRYIWGLVSHCQAAFSNQVQMHSFTDQVPELICLFSLENKAQLLEKSLAYTDTAPWTIKEVYKCNCSSTIWYGSSTIPDCFGHVS